MFSKKLYYGLQFLLALDSFAGEGFLGVADISAKEKLPLKFLEAIAVALRKADIIEVKRGAGGGYRLARRMEQINLLQVWDALEEKVEYSEDSSRKSVKAVNHFLHDAFKNYKNVLLEMKLDKIRKYLDDENEKIMYYI